MCGDWVGVKKTWSAAVYTAAAVAGAMSKEQTSSSKKHEERNYDQYEIL